MKQRDVAYLEEAKKDRAALDASAKHQVNKFVKKLVLAWDPNFSKVTPEEAARMKAAEKSGFLSDDEIEWDKIGQ
jgi:hypothetical protein